MNKKEKLVLLAYFTPLLDSTESLKLEYKATQKLEKVCSYHISSMMLGIHTNTCTTWYGLQIFFIHNENIAVFQWKQIFNPTLTSLERRKL